jgi:hypothetical protein
VIKQVYHGNEKTETFFNLKVIKRQKANNGKAFNKVLSFKMRSRSSGSFARAEKKTRQNSNRTKVVTTH